MPRVMSGMLDLLRDGEWHELAELAEELGIPIEYVREVAEFLVKHEHANFDEEKRRIKLKPDFLELVLLT